MGDSGIAPVPGDVVLIKVDFELDTPDGLRTVFFGLEKSLRGGATIWTIHFRLQERDNQSQPFINIVTLNVMVSDASLQSAAQTAANNGLTPAQAAHAMGPAADDAKAVTTGDLDPEDAKATIQGTLAIS